MVLCTDMAANFIQCDIRRDSSALYTDSHTQNLPIRKILGNFWDFQMSWKYKGTCHGIIGKGIFFLYLYRVSSISFLIYLCNESIHGARQDRLLISDIHEEKLKGKENIARIANAVQVTICLLVSTSVY